ncbi:MAG TPA: hypothetical protein VF668_01275 [Pyrinomonadaceae bacterium]|jgi:hypothetical protein
MPEDHPEELLTKEEIARELNPAEPLSIRSVERYIKIANDEGAAIIPAVKGSGRGKQAKFRRADVEKIKAAYQASAEAREQQQQQTAALAPSRAGLPAPLVEQLVADQRRGFEELRQALDPWPMWLTRTDALERTGLPPTWFDLGVKKELLPFVGVGRSRRYHRDHVRTFAGSIREGDFLKALLKKPAQLAATRS